MKEAFKMIHRTRTPGAALSSTANFGLQNAEKALAFHRSFPEYRETPLAGLHELAAQLGVASIHVKDESYRFGLNAFKVLGGSYSIGNYIANRLGEDITALPYE